MENENDEGYMSPSQTKREIIQTVERAIQFRDELNIEIYYQGPISDDLKGKPESFKLEFKTPNVKMGENMMKFFKWAFWMIVLIVVIRYTLPYMDYYFGT